MPTQELWMDDNIMRTVWTSPLTLEDLTICFSRLANMLNESETTIHILFDITESGIVPASAPIAAINSRFLNASHIGKVAVVGMDIIPQILAQVAATVTRKDILFFPRMDSALNYLHQTD